MDVFVYCVFSMGYLISFYSVSIIGTEKEMTSNCGCVCLSSLYDHVIEKSTSPSIVYSPQVWVEYWIKLSKLTGLGEEQIWINGKWMN